MGTGKNKCLNSNLGLCMCVHEQNRKQQFVMVDPVDLNSLFTLFYFEKVMCTLLTIDIFKCFHASRRGNFSLYFGY